MRIRVDKKGPWKIVDKSLGSSRESAVLVMMDIGLTEILECV